MGTEKTSPVMELCKYCQRQRKWCFVNIKITKIDIKNKSDIKKGYEQKIKGEMWLFTVIESSEMIFYS